MTIVKLVEDFINDQLLMLANEYRDEMVEQQYQEYLSDMDAMFEEMYSQYSGYDYFDEACEYDRVY